MYVRIMFIEEGKNELYMTSGSFTISKESNGDLKIVLDGILMDGRDLEGTYIGSFSDLEESFVEPLFGTSKKASFLIRK